MELETTATLEDDKTEEETINKKWGSFEFDLEVAKSSRDTDGVYHLYAVASDTQIDYQKDQMTLSALKKMEKQLKTEKIPLLENHDSTFHFGYIDSAKVTKAGTDNWELEVDLILDESFPQSKSLIKAVAAGKPKYQLSIGGKINKSNPNAVIIKYDKTTGERVKQVNDVVLEHIACTRPNWAANSRSRFLASILKSLNGIEKDELLYKKYLENTSDKKDEIVQDVNSNNTLEKNMVDHIEKESLHQELLGEDLKTIAKGVIASLADIIKSRNAVTVPKEEKSTIILNLQKQMKELGLESPTETQLDAMDNDSFILFFKNQGFNQSFLEELMEKPLDNKVEKDQVKVSEVETAICVVEDAVKKGFTADHINGILGAKMRGMMASLNKILNTSDVEKTTETKKEDVATAPVENTENISKTEIVLSKESIDAITKSVIEQLSAVNEKVMDDVAEKMAASKGLENISKSINTFYMEVKKDLSENKSSVDILSKRLETVETVSGVTESVPAATVPATKDVVQKSKGGTFSGMWQKEFQKANAVQKK